jgi:hypothetical protein
MDAECAYRGLYYAIRERTYRWVLEQHLLVPQKIVDVGRLGRFESYFEQNAFVRQEPPSQFFGSAVGHSKDVVRNLILIVAAVVVVVVVAPAEQLLDIGLVDFLVESIPIDTPCLQNIDPPQH